MGREIYLADLYRQSVRTLTQSRTEWMGLLSGVSKFYRMSFDKNVLIYVQRPDAGLLATKAGWEKQTGRYLKAGSKGIGVVDMILSRLVDTFSSRILYLMLLLSGNHSIAAVLSWEEDLH